MQLQVTSFAARRILHRSSTRFAVVGCLVCVLGYYIRHHITARVILHLSYVMKKGLNIGGSKTPLERHKEQFLDFLSRMDDQRIDHTQRRKAHPH